jgi:hypothetical protein
MIRTKQDAREYLEGLDVWTETTYLENCELVGIVTIDSVSSYNNEVYTITRMSTCYRLHWRQGATSWQHCEEVSLDEAVDHVYKYRRAYNRGLLHD